MFKNLYKRFIGSAYSTVDAFTYIIIRINVCVLLVCKYTKRVVYLLNRSLKSSL